VVQQVQATPCVRSKGRCRWAEARAIIDQAIANRDGPRAFAFDANGRALARDVAADADVPPFSRRWTAIVLGAGPTRPARRASPR
jgi:hypothetical protein